MHYCTRKAITIYVPIALFLICFLFKIVYIEKRDVSIDEPFSIFNAQKSISEIINLSSTGEPNPPTYTILLHFWIKIFGSTAFSVRLLSLIFNSLTAVLIYQIGRKHFSFLTGIAASLLFIFSFYNFFHGLEARVYALFVLATSLSLYFYLDLLKVYSKTSILGLIVSKTTIAGLIISNIILVYTHYFGWFIILVQFLGLILYLKNFRTIITVLIVHLITVIAFSPMLLIVLNQYKESSKGTWLQSPQLSDYLMELHLLFNHIDVFKAFVIVCVVGIIFFIYRKQKKKIGKPQIIMLLWWFVPYTLMFIISFKTPIFNSRYILYNSVGLYLFATALISFLYSSKRSYEVMALSVVVIMMAVKLRILPDDFGRREIKDTVGYVKTIEKQLKNRTILLYPAWSDLPFMYYYDKEVFSNPTNFYENCKEDRIVRVWDSSDLSNKLKHFGDNDIIIVIDRSDEEAAVFFKAMEKTHTQLQTREFLETYTVGVFRAEF